MDVLMLHRLASCVASSLSGLQRLLVLAINPEFISIMEALRVG